MIAYASRTGTKRNLRALAGAGWGLLVSPSGPWRREGFDLWVAENGQWTEREKPGPFNFERYEKFLSWVAGEDSRPQWIALPDIVFGGLPSLELSRLWWRRLSRRKIWAGQRFMLVVQDGMEPRHIRRLIGPRVGIFVGGSTDWKLATIGKWAALAHKRGAECHVGRVNTARRIRLCAAAGVDSIDGTSASRFAVTLPPLDLAIRQGDFEGYLARAAA